MAELASLESLATENYALYQIGDDGIRWAMTSTKKSFDGAWIRPAIKPRTSFIGSSPFPYNDFLSRAGHEQNRAAPAALHGVGSKKLLGGSLEC